ncbi:MAG: FkbM family methyltransferase [Myxococcota bacterium]
MTTSLDGALARLGRDVSSRDGMLDLLRTWESAAVASGEPLRELVTGPIADALFAPGEPVTVELSDGTRLAIPYRGKIARDIALRDRSRPDHAFEPQTTRLLLRWARGARTALVGGAYAGDHVCPLARRMVGGRVIAFEPNDEQRGFLQRNLSENGLTDVVVRAEALWDQAGVRLAFEGEDAYARVVETSGAGLEATTIDAVLSELGVDSLDVILLDIEGSELRALKGASGQLELPPDRAPNIIFELHALYSDWSNGLGGTEIVQELAGRGYSVFALRDFQTNIDTAGCALELVELEGCYLDGPPHGFNMVATKRPEQFSEEGYRVLRGVSPKLLLHRDPRLHAPTEWLSGRPRLASSSQTPA